MRHSVHRSTTVTLLLLGLGAPLAVGLTAPSVSAQSLAKRLTRRIEQAPLDRNLWGIAVLDARGRLLFGRNAERLFMPASNTKLIVTSVATARLGPDWRVTTSVYAGGPIRSGVLEGDLVLYGRGDPTWGPRCFAVDTLAAGVCDSLAAAPLDRLAHAVHDRGIRIIAGDVLGDGSWFEPAAVHPTWENDDLVWGYAAPVTALGYHENTFTLRVTPAQSPGAPARLELDPDLGAVELINRTTTVDDTTASLEVTRPPGSWRVVVSGSVRLGRRPWNATLAAPDGNRWTALAFRQALETAGIEVRGTARSTVDSAATRAARAIEPLAEIASRPLADWIFAILNVSQNWYAETLLKQLGRAFGDGGSWDEGLRVERRFLVDSMGIDSTQFLVHDGSGLSAKDLVTPLTFARILHFMRQRPFYPTFAAGIPQSGAIGTLRTRFVGTPLDGRVRAKTGSIGQVNTLSGYLEASTDSTALDRPPIRIFSIQANHHTLGGRAMIQAIDSLVVDIGRAAKIRGRR